MDPQQSLISDTRISLGLQIVIGALILVILYGIGLRNYLLFHSIVEIAGIAVAFSIFILVWNTRKMITNTFFLIVGISFLFTGSLDLIHTLAYKGMGVFPGTSADLPTQLWIAARYFQSLAFFIATLFIGRSVTRSRKYDAGIIFAACGVACGLLLTSIFVFGNFPTSFVEGSGLTPFKVVSEYIISFILLASVAILVLKRKYFDAEVWNLLIAALVFLILGELAFTDYATVYGPMNMLGHMFRLVSVYLFYRAFVVVGLTRPFDLLFRDLKQKQKELQGLSAELSNIIEHAPAMIWYKDTDNRYIRVNPAAAQSLGLSRGEIEGKSAYELLPDLAEKNYRDDLEVIRSGEPKLGILEKITRTPKGPLWFRTDKVPIRNAKGEVTGVLAFSTDITDLKQAEEAREEYAANLKRSNEDLERFAYVASHDLREPLRMVTSFSQLLERNYKGRLDQDADEFIGYIVDGGRKMDALVNDLLEFSRITSRGKPFEPTDMNELVSEVQKSLSVVIRENNAVIEAGHLPTIPVDRWQMALVFQNLISNAIKFREDAVPVVTIDGTRGEGEWLFTVRDNGIGIDPEYHGRIFELFQRLHSGSEYPGTGIGLAICKRIIERHGGRIWVESEPGDGSTFFFTIPDRN